MDKNRVYGEKIPIHMEKVQSFYNKRASLIAQKGWGAISLGDEDPSIASRTFDYDRDSVFPKLGVDSNSRVLELGCGMGRWATIILPHCGVYCGVDFSEEMLKAAEKICEKYAEKSSFFQLSASETAEKEPSFYGGAFHCIVLSGLCVHINDDELKRIFERLPALAQPHCTICVKETTAIDRRLTLNEFQSEALKSTYNAIYRTQEEYLAMFQPLLSAEFSIQEQYFLPEAVGRKRAETNSMCTILRR